MKISHILLAFLISCLFVSKAKAGCLCGAIGEDYCSKDCKNYRPVPKFLGKLDIPAPPLPPIGDRCSCGKQLVEPAIVPKTCLDEEIPSFSLPPPLPYYNLPLCGSCAASGKAVCKSCKAAAALKVSSPICPCQIGPWIHANSIPKKCSGIPADPVSVSIAQRNENSRSFSVPEEKVQYGHRTTPLCPLRRIYVSNIPEENLWAINRQIIELKRKGFTKKVDEEIIEEESEEEEIGPNPNYLTYGELGYCPENFKNAKFKNVPASGGSTPGVPDCMLPPPPIGDCGFKPGKIVPFNLIDPTCTMEEDHFEEV